MKKDFNTERRCGPFSDDTTRVSVTSVRQALRSQERRKNAANFSSL